VVTLIKFFARSGVHVNFRRIGAISLPASSVQPIKHLKGDALAVLQRFSDTWPPSLI